MNTAPPSVVALLSIIDPLRTRFSPDADSRRRQLIDLSRQPAQFTILLAGFRPNVGH